MEGWKIALQPGSWLLLHLDCQPCAAVVWLPDGKSADLVANLPVSLPQVDDVHPFYADLMNVLYDKVRQCCCLLIHTCSMHCVQRAARHFTVPSKPIAVSLTTWFLCTPPNRTTTSWRWARSTCAAT